MFSPTSPNAASEAPASADAGISNPDSSFRINNDVLNPGLSSTPNPNGSSVPTGAPLGKGGISRAMGKGMTSARMPIGKGKAGMGKQRAGFGTGKMGVGKLGRGKGSIGGKGLGLGKGKTGAKKHRKIVQDNIHGITKPSIRRLARRGGVKRMSGLIYEESRYSLRCFLEGVVRDSTTFTEHARRKTVTALDVVYALKRQGRTIYGFGH